MHQSSLISNEQQLAIADYADKHDIYDIFRRLMQRLIVERPLDPIQFMIDHLKMPKVPQIIVAGPPGCNRAGIALRMATKINALFISAGAMLQTAVEKQTSLGMQAKPFIDKNLMVPDNIVIALMMSRFSEPDALARGWVVEGFPRTIQQAQTMQTKGVLADHLIMLELSETEIVKEVTGSLYDPKDRKYFRADSNASMNSPVELRSVLRKKDEEAGLRARIRAHTESTFCIHDSFRSILKSVAISHEDYVNPSPLVLRLLDIIGTSSTIDRHAPKMWKVAMVSSSHINKSIMCEKLAQSYGCVHISVLHVLRNSMAKGNEALKPFVNSLFEAPASLIVPLLKHRISQDDCFHHGWILDGFPNNKVQAECLAANGIQLNRLMILRSDLDAESGFNVAELKDYYNSKTSKSHRDSQLPTILHEIHPLPMDPQLSFSPTASKLDIIQGEGRRQAGMADLDYDVLLDELKSFMIRPVPIRYT